MRSFYSSVLHGTGADPDWLAHDDQRRTDRLEQHQQGHPGLPHHQHHAPYLQHLLR